MARGEKILGTLCRRGHDYNGIGESLRYRRNRQGGQGGCVECLAITALRNREANPERYREVKEQYRIKNRKRQNQWAKDHYAANIERIKAEHKKYYQKNKEKVLARQLRRFNEDRSARYRKYNEYKKIQLANNTQFGIGLRLRSLVSQAFRKYTKTGKIMISSKYGIDYKAIIAHLGPHPNTLGIKGDFHIDHIVPVSFFDLNDLDQVRIAFAPSNHRWLLASENRSKNDNMPLPEEMPLEIVALLESHNIGIPINA